MYYSNGNYEAFARPRKPNGVDQKSAYLVGGGIASLAAAAFLIRDGQMDGSRITIYEASNIVGGALDGTKDPQEGYLFRGERGDAAANKVRGLLVDACRLAGTVERLVVAIAVVH